MLSPKPGVALPRARGFIVALSSLFGIGIALAAPGDLDSGFGDNGLLSLTIGVGFSSAYAVVQQSDGKLVLAGDARGLGTQEFIGVRLAADGTPDAAFGAGGFVSADFGGTGDVAFAVIQQPDGKLVLVGTAGTIGIDDEDISSDMALARFNADGTPDTTFGNAGLVTLDLDVFDYAFDAIQQADGKLVVAGMTNSTNEFDGTSRATFARFNADGSLDSSFGSGGTVSVDFGSGLQSRADSLTQQADGMLVAVGSVWESSLLSSDMGLVRLTADGVLDPLFDGDGMIAVDFDGDVDQGQAAAIQPDGAIVVAGSASVNANTHAALFRVNGDGSLDSSFGEGGKTVIFLGNYSTLNAILVRADNSLVATGGRRNSDSSEDMILMRFTADGSLDLAYGVEGVATADFGSGNATPHSQGFALIQQTDGKLVAVGRNLALATLAAARFDDGATFAGTIGFLNAGRRIAEATVTVVYTVRRTGGSDGSVSVEYATANDTATSGSDFQEASGTLNWDDGDTSDRLITINLINDAAVEPEEDFSLTLSVPTGGAALAASQVNTDIVDDDLGGGNGGGNGGGGGAFGAWSLVFLYGFVFAGGVQRRRKYLA